MCHTCRVQLPCSLCLYTSVPSVALLEIYDFVALRIVLGQSILINTNIIALSAQFDPVPHRECTLIIRTRFTDLETMQMRGFW